MFALGDVGEGDAAHGRAGGVSRDGGFQVRPEGGAVWRHQPQFAPPWLTDRQELPAKVEVTILVLGVNKAGEPLADQRAPGHSQQGGGGKVSLQDQPVLVLAEGEIAYRGLVVEIGIARLGGDQVRLRPAQLFVLQR